MFKRFTTIFFVFKQNLYFFSRFVSEMKQKCLGWLHINTCLRIMPWTMDSLTNEINVFVVMVNENLNII